MGLRAVFDTNVLVSALLWKGTPHEILLKAFDGDFQIVLSPEIIGELTAVLQLKKFRLEKDEIEGLLRTILSIAEITKITSYSNVKLKDVGDQNIVDCAVTGKVDFIVTGDKELLDLGSMKGVKVITPKEFKKTLERSSHS